MLIHEVHESSVPQLVIPGESNFTSAARDKGINTVEGLQAHTSFRAVHVDTRQSMSVVRLTLGKIPAKSLNSERAEVLDLRRVSHSVFRVPDKGHSAETTRLGVGHVLDISALKGFHV